MDVGALLFAVGTSTVIATSVSAVVSWRIAIRQNDIEREKISHERAKLQHEVEKYEHEKRSRKRDDARALCLRLIEELSFMAASMDLLRHNWMSWNEETDREEIGEQVRRIHDDLNTVNAHMPGLLSDMVGAPDDVVPEEDWQELADRFLTAQQTYGHIVLEALNPVEFPNDAWREWVHAYGKANMAARRLMADIG